MKADDEQAFREFVTSQMASLRKLAYMTCGDWHTAEDAVANALIKLYPRWRRLERPDLYVKTMVYRAAIDETRRPWRRERSVGDAMPDVALRDPAAATDERMRLRAALDAVPARQRAAVVLRHYLGLSLEDTAGVLDCTVGTAKSQVSRGLAKLREALASEHISLSGKQMEEWTSAVA
ncbi:SigE family RNA polymerase sigma factor [Micromonospora carbonacea]|uniref:RNA polymerase sigma-70 factor, sigma-E family n=1 Tax=Micromonospora carbonacea TaxID=47853 RepID=A0A1C4YL25_9ACTN|nr:SigE family RNA polymerase sigma factor [Micromonospora carbonacea]MBB5829152.1 RNA polymerase sigma-70 factor (sigma-E family) [Micromonospora carbonacea]QLD23367.1 SigE family RNA polymerase sigma factor [Micromonospora carbonacea]SCF21356.1 RNA polymerase sigma-70 factor, sigma-E family [Micromonospora carbonacea]